MAKRTQTIPIPMPDRGVDVNTPSTFLDKRSTPASLNCRYDKGIISPRPGTDALGTYASYPLSGTILNMDMFNKIDGSQVFVCVSTVKLHYSANEGDSWTTVAYETSGAVDYPVSTCHCSHAIGDGGLSDGYYYVISNNKNPVNTWLGSGATADLETNWQDVLYNDTIIAKQVMNYKNSLLLLATTENSTLSPNKVRWSQTGCITEHDTSATNAGYLFLYDSPGYIQWGAMLRDNVIIYKTDSIVQFSYTGGTGLFRTDTIVADVGLLAPGLLAVLDGEHIFVGKTNIYRWSGGAKPDPIGDRVFQDLLDNMVWDSLEYCQTQVNKEKGWIKFYTPTVVGGSRFLKRCYTYNYIDDSWAIDTYDRSVGAVGILDEKGSQNIAVQSVGGYVYELTSSAANDAGTIDQVHETIDFVPDSKEYEGRHVGYQGIAFDAYGAISDATDTISVASVASACKITTATVHNLKTGDKVAISGVDNDVGVAINGATYVTTYVDANNFTIPVDTSALTGEEGTEGDIANQLELYVSYSIDEGSNWTSIGNQTITTAWAYYVLPFRYTGRKIRFRFRNNRVNENFHLRWVGVKAIPRGRAT